MYSLVNVTTNVSIKSLSYQKRLFLAKRMSSTPKKGSATPKRVLANKPAVVQPSFNYFERIKYLPYVKPTSLDHSYVWLKWVRYVRERKLYYRSLQESLRASITKSCPDLEIVGLKPKGSNIGNKAFYYALTSGDTQRFVRRRKVNFFTYRKLRYNQLRLFYTTCNQKQFQNLYKSYGFLKKRVLDQFLLSLEARLEFFLFRTNLFASKPFIRQFLHHHGVLVNGFLVKNKSYILKPWDVVALPKTTHSWIFSLLKTRTLFLRKFKSLPIRTLNHKKHFVRKMMRLMVSPLLSINFFMNYPRYMEVDYTLLEAVLIRNPSHSEITLPANSELDNTNRSYYKW